VEGVCGCARERDNIKVISGRMWMRERLCVYRRKRERVSVCIGVRERERESGWELWENVLARS
jgi:hypothetical protein